MKRGIIVKLGTNVVMKDNKFNKTLINELAKELSNYKRQGNEVIIVTSGAIGLGVEKLHFNNKSLSLEEQQACAAVGQSLLMHEYEKAFSKHNQSIAQLLLTQENFLNKIQLKNLQDTLHKLGELNAVPIINENDAVSTQELKTKNGFSDNDSLAALVALHCKADLLVLVTDVSGVFKQDPKKDSKTELIKELKSSKELKKIQAGSASSKGKGGFKTKLKAAEKAATYGIDCIICNGKKGIIKEILSGKNHGTLIKGLKK